MLNQFLNTRIPSILSALAFSGCCLMFCFALAGARDSGEITPTVLRGLVLWGTLSLITMLAFCLCLARVTRYRRSLPTN